MTDVSLQIQVASEHTSEEIEAFRRRWDEMLLKDKQGRILFMDGLGVGRAVHFVIPEDEMYRGAMGNTTPVPSDWQPRWRQGQHVAGMVVGVPQTRVDGVANLQVFYDAPMMGYQTDVPYSEEHAPGSWHWPERV